MLKYNVYFYTVISLKAVLRPFTKVVWLKNQLPKDVKYWEESDVRTLKFCFERGKNCPQPVQRSLSYIVGELAEGGSVDVAVGVTDM